jgi:hypothetical protein
MTAPDDLVDLEVPAEQLRAGDVLVIDTVEHHVERVDAGPDAIRAYVPDELPIPRGRLVPVRRPRSATSLADRPAAVDPVEYAAVRDLALALAEFAGPSPAKGADAGKRVTDRAARVRTRLEETRTDGTDRPTRTGDPTEPAPVLEHSPAGEPAAAAPVQPAGGNPAPAATGPAAPPDPRGSRRDR